jgi:hypothetical protein
MKLALIYHADNENISPDDENIGFDNEKIGFENENNILDMKKYSLVYSSKGRRNLIIDNKK